MSDRGSDDGKMGAFLLGFILGVVVCLGAGGVFYFRQVQQGRMLAEQAAMERDRAMEMEVKARMMAEEARRQTDLALEKVREAKAREAREKEKDKGKAKE